MSARRKLRPRRSAAAGTAEERRGQLFGRRWFQALVVLAMGGALAAVIVYQPQKRTYIVNVDDLERGQPAPRSITATHNFAVIHFDTVATEALRQEAAEAVPEVYHFDLSLRETVARRVDATFRMMRERLAHLATERRTEMLERIEEGAPPIELPPSDAADQRRRSAWEFGVVTANQVVEHARRERARPSPTPPSEEPPESPPGATDSAGLEAAVDEIAAETASGEPAPNDSGQASTSAESSALGQATPASAPLELLTEADLETIFDDPPVNDATGERNPTGPAAGLQNLTRTFHQSLGASLQRSTRLALARDGFSETTAQYLSELVHSVLAHRIVEDLPLLQAEGHRGVTLQTRYAERPQREEHVEDFSDFHDASEIRSLVDEAAARIVPDTLPPQTRQAIIAAAYELVKVNTERREDTTAARREAARDAVSPVTQVTPYDEGQVIVYQNHPVTEADLAAIRLMRQLGSHGPQVRASQVVTGGVIYVLLVLFGVVTYGIRFVRRFRPSFKDLALMGVTLLVMVTVTKLVTMLAGLVASSDPDFPVMGLYAAIPFAAGAMLVRVVLNAENALLFSVVFSLLVALLIPDQPIFAAYALVGSLAGMGAVEIVRARMSLFRAGLLVGGVNCAFALAIALMDSSFLTFTTVKVLGLAVLGGIVVGILVTALLPVVETSFHYISDIKLLELANPNHPLMKDLLMRAPGSYHHSMMVGSLVESACKAIGANALLGRVGSYYHDIGKTKNPKYFAENQSGRNPHDKLKPHMSALIIKSHVKDGVEMALEHDLPKEIIDFIQEHHGTSLIAFFYHKACEQAEGDGRDVNEDEFRYGGPKPQSNETAVCMLADGIEAASRSMPDPTPARLKGLVQKMINRAFTDGQLDQCDLTLRDLDAIAGEFIRILVSIYHQRPQYPGDRREAVTTRETKPVSAREGENGGGDSDEVEPHDEAGDSGYGSPERSTATLRRLGISQSRAVDSAHRRPRD